MAETWYEITTYLNRIKAVPVEKVTDAFVVISGRRHARQGGMTRYEPTYEQARATLINYHEELVGKAATVLAVQQRDLDLAKGLPEENPSNA